MTVEALPAPGCEACRKRHIDPTHRGYHDTEDLIAEDTAAEHHVIIDEERGMTEEFRRAIEVAIAPTGRPPVRSEEEARALLIIALDRFRELERFLSAHPRAV